MKEAIVDKVRAAGIVGAGGAGFPTHVKLQFDVKRVLANGASCEPLLASDPYLMEYRTDRVLDGLAALMDGTNAPQGTVCIKSKHPQAIKSLRDALADGPHGQRIDLFELADFYPAGDEFILVREVLGQTVPEGGIPLNLQAVVSNIESLLNVSRAMEGKPVTDRYLTVCGEVRNPMVCKVPLGTPIADIIEMAGGTTAYDYGIIMGGPMMGCVLDDPSFPVTKTTSGVIVLPAEHNVIRDKRKQLSRMRRLAKAACTQCSRCTDLCPRNLIGHQLRPHRIMRHLAYQEGLTGEILEEALLCCECGVCEKFACPMMLSPREINAVVKKKLMQDGVKRQPGDDDYRVSPFYQTRKIPVKRLLQRLDIKRYAEKPEFFPDTVSVNRVTLLLQQHLGRAAEAVVRTGDTVRKGDLVAEIPEGALGARIHASINGRIETVEADRVIIQGN